MFEGNIKKATECAENTLRYSNSTIEKISALEKLSKVFAISGNYQESLKMLLELLKYNKKATYYYNLALLCTDLNDYDNSVVYIRKALELEPTNEDYKNILKDIEAKLSTKQG